MKRTLALISFLLCFIVVTGNAQHQREAKVTSTPIVENLFHLETPMGTNLVLYTGECGPILIDTEYAQHYDLTVKTIAENTDRPVKIVINTHYHFDHVGGNQLFYESGSIIVAHENVRRRMEKDQHLAVLDYDIPASTPEALPAITFTDTLTLQDKDEEITIRHLRNAHTDGDSVVHFKKANVIHAGDIFFNCGYPFMDVLCGGSIDGLIKAAETVLELCDEETKIVPGHGPLANKSDLEEYLGMLKEFRSIIAREIKAGKNLETILQDQSTKALDPKYGGRFFSPAQFTEMVYLSLMEKQ